MNSTKNLFYVGALSLATGCAYHPAPHYAEVPVFHDDVVAAPVPAPVSAYPAPATVEPVYPNVPAGSPVDMDLTTTIRHQFDRYGDLSAVVPNIDISATQGTVTLVGSVPNEKDKEMILAMVKNTPGVVRVNDLLHVANGSSNPVQLQPTGRAPGTSPGQVEIETPNVQNNLNLHFRSLTPQDRALAQRLADGLQNSNGLQSMQHVNVVIQNGQVSLQGLVQDEQERQNLLRAAANVAGAANVVDRLQVQQPPP